jgi:hypothetical protein
MGKFSFQIDDQPAVSGDAKLFSVKWEDTPAQKPLPVASVSVVLAPTTLAIGEKAIASASTFDKDGHPLVGRGIAWSSDNTSAATVSPSGEVTAVGAGSVGIVATSEGRQGNFGLVIAPAAKWTGADRRFAQRRLSSVAFSGPEKRSGSPDRRVAPAAPFGVPISPAPQPSFPPVHPWDGDERRVDERRDELLETRPFGQRPNRRSGVERRKQQA